MSNINDPTLNDPISFIKLLKSQHRSIISTVCEIDSQSEGPSNLTGSIDKLNKITDLLFDHLEKEDKHLYPILINNTETQEIGEKYFYDMERLSCIALDFFKRYCVNKEGLKIFVEDFINGYSLFRGLLKTRIKREETELYPAYILLQSGVLHSDVLDYVQEHGLRLKENQKNIIIYSENQPKLEAVSLALEIVGYKVISTRSISNLSSLSEKIKSDLILMDVGQSNKELMDLVAHLKNDMKTTTPLVAFSILESKKLEEELGNKFDSFISKPAIDIEAFSERVKEILTK